MKQSEKFIELESLDSYEEGSEETTNTTTNNTEAMIKNARLINQKVDPVPLVDDSDTGEEVALLPKSTKKSQKQSVALSRMLKKNQNLVLLDDGSVVDITQFGGVSGGDDKKCVRCGEMYDVEKNHLGACKFHPGTFKAPRQGGMVPTSSEWSCCKSVIPDPESGCVQGFHIEDTVVSSVMNTYFDPHTEKEKKTSQAIINTEESDEKEDKKEEKIEEDSFEETDTLVKIDGKIFLKYVVEDSDSLVGICLKFKLKKAVVKKINKIFSDDQIKAVNFLLLPYNAELMADYAPLEETSQENLITQFIIHAKVSRDEALVYLETNDYNLEHALSEWKEDIEFEKQHKS